MRGPATPQSTAPAPAPIPFHYTRTALADIDEALAFMEKHAGASAADKWYDALRKVLDTEAELLTSVRIGRPTEVFDDVTVRRLNFRTPSGSPWRILYDLEVNNGAPVSFTVLRVRHGASAPDSQ